MKVTEAKLSDLVDDDMNANLHSTRGEFAVEESMSRYGFAEAGTLDKNNKIIGGNLRKQVAERALHTDDVIILDVDGTKPVYIRRTDVDLNTKEGHELALALNRTGQLSLFFSGDVVDALEEELGIDVDWLFTDDELDGLHRETADLDFDGLDGANGDGDNDSFDNSVELTVNVPNHMLQAVTAFLDRHKGKGVRYSRND